MIVTEIVPSQIVPFPADDSRRNDGSEIVFNGRVRSTEHGEPILALEYEHYEGMAETELYRLAKKRSVNFPSMIYSVGTELGKSVLVK